MINFKVKNTKFMKEYKQLQANCTLTISDNGVLFMDTKMVLKLVKATGLRSKKSRHINKRFKAIINYAINKLVDEVTSE